MWTLTQRTFVGSEGGFARPTTIARLLAVGVLVVAALAACTKAPASSSTHTVTITASGPTSGSSASSSSASSATSSQPATPMTKFSGNCYALLTLYDVQRAAGYTIGGKTAFIVGVPDKTLGRLSYLNCRYGLPAAAPGRSATPQIEINVALYSTPAQAAKRAASTVSDYVANGATATQVTIGDVPGTILTGGLGAGYSVPLLVTSSGQRTVAVSLNKSGLSAARRTQILSNIGALAVTNTAS
jgi:hypothetical protein